MSILSKLGSPIRTAAKAKSAVTEPGTRSARRIGRAGLKRGAKAAVIQRQKEMQKYQAKMGARMLGVGGVGLGAALTSRNSSARRGGYSAPVLREPKGSGRYA